MSMQRFPLAAIALFTVFALCACDSAMHRTVTTEEHIDAVATVRAVDVDARLLAFETPTGRRVIHVGPEVKKLAEIHPGDRLKIRYSEAIARCARRQIECAGHDWREGRRRTNARAGHTAVGDGKARNTCAGPRRRDRLMRNGITAARLRDHAGEQRYVGACSLDFGAGLVNIEPGYRAVLMAPLGQCVRVFSGFPVPANRGTDGPAQTIEHGMHILMCVISAAQRKPRPYP